MTPKQRGIIKRLQRAMDDAKKAGLVTFCDVEAWGIRLVPKELIADFDSDPREHGEVVEAPDGPLGLDDVSALGEVVVCQSTCGTPSGPRDGLNAL